LHVFKLPKKDQSSFGEFHFPMLSINPPYIQDAFTKMLKTKKRNRKKMEADEDEWK
jgi:hypothetical protein